MRRARVATAHRAPDREPIRCTAGDTMTLGERDTEWPEFIWAELEHGQGGWIPAALFAQAGDRAVITQDYDTRELEADPGDELRLHNWLADWWWAENANGTCGWIPARAIVLID